MDVDVSLLNSDDGVIKSHPQILPLLYFNISGNLRLLYSDASGSALFGFSDQILPCLSDKRVKEGFHINQFGMIPVLGKLRPESVFRFAQFF